MVFVQLLELSIRKLVGNTSNIRVRLFERGRSLLSADQRHPFTIRVCVIGSASTACQ